MAGAVMGRAHSGGARRRHYRSAAAALLALVALSGASDPGGGGAAPAAFAAGGGAFGIDLYRQLMTQPGNIAISPVSVMQALALTTEGAAGETRAAMRRALRLGEGAAPTLPAAKRDDATLRIANALWVGRPVQLKPAFVATARNRYGARAATVDFRGNRAGAVKTINDWGSQATAKRIPALVTPDLVHADTALIVTNAVYFLADWRAPFNPRATRDAPFFVAGGAKRPVRMMSAWRDVRYAADREVQAIDLPYKGDALVMTILLPTARDGLSALERTLDRERLRSYLARIDAAPVKTVDVRLPRFEARAGLPLKAPLTALGMGVAFTDRADFSGIANVGLTIDDVIHRSFVRVDERGTEAAATTAVMMSTVSAPAVMPPVFRADHPFLYLIRDRTSGAILFIGRLADPST